MTVSIGMAMWFMATSISPVITPWETRENTLERIISSPLTVKEMLLGDVLASAVVGVALTSITALPLIMILSIPMTAPLTFVGGMIVAALGFSSLGVLMAAIPTDTTSDIMMLATLVKFPIIFVSGIFIPIAEMPSWSLPLAYLSPLTYFVQVTRYGLGSGDGGLLWLGGLVLFSLFTFAIAVVAHRKTLPQRL